MHTVENHVSNDGIFKLFTYNDLSDFTPVNPRLFNVFILFDVRLLQYELKQYNQYLQKVRYLMIVTKHNILR